MKGGDTDDVAAALEAINGITEKENEKFYEKENWIQHFIHSRVTVCRYHWFP